MIVDESQRAPRVYYSEAQLRKIKIVIYYWEVSSRFPVSHTRHTTEISRPQIALCPTVNEEPEPAVNEPPQLICNGIGRRGYVVIWVTTADVKR
jgi:hypothetical protein